ncbi:MAG: DUF6605 domain-containing protein [Nitrospiraceae bacterium]
MARSGRSAWLTVGALIVTLTLVACAGITKPHGAAPSAALSPVALENRLPGDADWPLTNPIDHGHEIEGYASDTSIERGQSIGLFVNSSDPRYTLTVYRMGWYGGAGARRMHGPVTLDGRVQPAPFEDARTGLIECDWQESYRLTTDTSADNWLSGVYLVKLTAEPSGKQSYIIFVIREDARPSELLFQSSVTTYQAYNSWGGRSTYPTNSTDFLWARKVSFNRPYARAMHPQAGAGVGAGDFLTATSIHPGSPVSPAGWEYNMVRWLEREGYDVTYSTDLDTHDNPEFWRGHRAWLSVGHDEYWSHAMRTHVEAARDAGVGLGFFSSNTAYWQMRLEPSVTTGRPNRTMVAYKEYALTEDPYALDDDPTNDGLVTGQWRDAPVRRPEHRLLGVMYETVPVDGDIVITNPEHPLFAGVTLPPDRRLPGLLGYEIDRTFPDGPANLTVLARSPASADRPTAIGEMTLYRAASGAWVFATGSMQWSWGLDDYHTPMLRTSRLNPVAQQITRNVLRLLTGDRPASQ